MTVTINGTTGISTPADTIAGGNLTFTGTGNRITGDFSNATVANRVAFQTSTTNGSTSLIAIPNGTGTISAVSVANASDPTNAGLIGLVSNTSEGRIQSSYLGAGTYLPMTFYTGGSERMRIDTSGNVGIGTSSPGTVLEVKGNPQTAFTNTPFNITSIGSLTGYSAGNGSGILFQASYNSSNSLAGYACISGIKENGTDGNYAGALTFMTRPNGSGAGNFERMRISSEGLVGIGVSSPVCALDVYTANTANAYRVLNIYNSAATSTGALNNVLVRIASGASGADTTINLTDSNTYNAYITMRAGNLIFSPNGGAEAVRVDTSGNLLMGTTSAFARITVDIAGSSSGEGIGIKAAAAGNFGMEFKNSSNSSIGTIVLNASTTSFNTTSDYRLKENVKPMQNALGVVAQLNPVTYTWKADGSDGQGFIAHELQAVVPDCVTGEKDAVDAEGNPVYQGIDTSFLVATLTKAIQELKQELDELKAKVN